MNVAQISGKPTSSLESHGQRGVEPIIHCPHCQAEIKLTESLAVPLLKSRELEFKRLEGELRQKEASLQRQREGIEQGSELELKHREVDELGTLLKSCDTKLAESLPAQATVVRN